MRDNIIQVFSKFVGEGKATIKFKEPAHDLCISNVSGHHAYDRCVCANAHVCVCVWVLFDNYRQTLPN